MPDFAPRIARPEKNGELAPHTASPLRAPASVQRLAQLSDSLHRRPSVVAQSRLSDELSSRAAAQRQPNRTGLPDGLKHGVEGLSGLSLDDVRVHYNSPRPAQLQAHAFTQGADIHVAAGQERHLAHEAWHVVQQKQGRVQPTLQLRGIAINDESALEREADIMGAKAVASRPADDAQPAQRHIDSGSAPIQRRVGFEFETGIPVRKIEENGELGGAPPAKEPFYVREMWHIETDASNMEFVSEPIDNTGAVPAIVGAMVSWVKDLQRVPQSVAPSHEQGMLNIDRQEQEHGLLGQANLDRQTVIDMAVKNLEVEERVVVNWIEKYGLGPVHDLAEKGQGLPPSYFESLLRTYQEMDNRKEPDFNKDRGDLIERNFYRKLDDMTQSDGLTVKNLAAPGDLSNVTAAPQATMGIPFDDLIDALLLLPEDEYLTGPDRNRPQTKTLSGANPADGKILMAAREAALKMVAPQRDIVQATEKQWREVEGFWALVISYIMKGNAERDLPFDYAKIIAPLMSRLDFGTMHAALAPQLQFLFGAKDIAKAAGAHPDTPVFGEKGFGKGGRGPTVAAWVDSILAGKDEMSLAAKTRVTDDTEGGSSSMGEFTQFDTTDKRAPGGLVPLELRRLPKGLGLEDWATTAYQIFITAESIIDLDLY